MAAAARGMLAFWMGGAGAVTPTTTGGVKSLLAPWMGGAGAPPAAATTGGNRSLLAFWLGGAGAVPGDVPPPTPPVNNVLTGGGGNRRATSRANDSTGPQFGAEFARVQAARLRRQREDELMLTIIVQAVTKGLL